MMSNKRIYSLNLVTYIWCRTGIQPELHVEEGGLIWCAYPEGGEVGKAITEYRNPEVAVCLHEYLQKYKQLRTMIEEARSNL